MNNINTQVTAVNRVVKFYKYYLFCKNAIWIAPIVTLFYLLHELSFTEIFLIASYYKIAVAFFEVPTGAFADKYGHKKSVLLGLIVFGIGLIAYPVYSGFWYFILIETFLAIGATLLSGADESLFYDSLKKLDREKEYTTLLGRAKQYAFLSQFIGAIVSSILYTINPMFPFFISGILTLVGFIIFSQFVDVESNEKEESKISYFDQIKETGKYIFNHKKIRTIILYSSLINMIFLSLVHTYAPYFLSVGIKEEYFGVIFAFFNIIALISSRYNDKYIRFAKSNSLIFLSIILIISYLILGFVSIPIGIIGIIFQQVYRGISSTTINKYVNKNSPSAKRATILSYLSLSSTLFGGIFGVILGIIMDNYNINQSYLIMAVIMIIITVIMKIVLDKNLSNMKDTCK